MGYNPNFVSCFHCKYFVIDDSVDVRHVTFSDMGRCVYHQEKVNIFAPICDNYCLRQGLYTNKKVPEIKQSKTRQ